MLFLLGLSLSATFAFAASPNVVLILASQQNCDLGCYGNPEVRTPNLDKLAARGIRFLRAYAQHSVAGPSRVSLLTGLRPDSLGIMYNFRYSPELPKGAFTLGQWLKQNDWYTAKAGRVFPREDYITSWVDTLGGPVEADELPSGTKTLLSVPTQTHLVNGEKQGLGGNLAVRMVDLPDAELVDGRSVTDALQLLQTATASKKPFFLAVGFMAPDFRMAAPKSWLDRYGKVTVTPRPAVQPGEGTPPAALWGGILPTPEVTAEERVQLTAHYRAMTSYMDAQAGKVLDAIDQMGLTKNTIVVFAAVTGFHLGDHGNLWGAGSLFEGAVRVPLIIAGPGIAAGQASPRVVELVDLAPTLLDLCRVKPLRVADGESFAPLLRQPTAPLDQPAVSFVQNYGPHAGAAVRTEIGSYIQWDGGRSGVELYDYQADPGELTNLAADKKMAPVLRKMQAELKKQTAKKK